MALEIGARLFDAAGTRVPLPDAYVAGWEFALSERGGCDTCSLDLAADYEDAPAIALMGALPAVDWRVEFWTGGYCLYRGWIEQAEPVVAEGEPVLRLSGAGLMARADTLRVDASYCQPGGEDVARIAGWLAERWLCRPDRIPDLVLDLPASVGYAIELAQFFGSTVRGALDNLCDAAQGLMIWGFGVSASGANVLWVRRKPTACTREDYRFRVGKDVVYLSQPRNLADVTNAILLTGGKAKAPNLLYNSDFRFPLLPGESSISNRFLEANYPGFEKSDWGPWDRSAGVLQGTTGKIPGQYAHSGERMAVLPASNTDYLRQAVSVDGWLKANAPTPWLFTFWAAQTYGGGLGTNLRIRIDALDASQQVLATLLDYEDWTVNGTFYQQYRRVFEVPAALASTCKSLLPRVMAWNGPGIPAVNLDDFGLFRNDAATQDGWQLLYYRSDDGKPSTVAKAYADWNRHDGLYSSCCLRVYVTAANATHNVWLLPTSDHYSAMRTGTEYQMAVWMRTTQALPFRLGVQVFNANDGSEPFGFGSQLVTIADGQWHRYPAAGWESLNSGFGGSPTGIRLILALEGVGDYDITAVALREGGGDPLDDSFVPSEQAQWYFRADNGEGAVPLPTSGPGALSAASQTSIATYGLREREVSAEEITDLKRAKEYAVGVLNRDSQPLGQGVLALEPAEVPITHLALDGTAATGRVRVDGLVTPIEQYPARILYRLGASGGVRIECDLENRRPDVALLLLEALGAKYRGGAGSSGGNSSFGSTPGNSVSGPSSPVPQPVVRQFGPDEAGLYQRTWDADGAETATPRRNGTLTLTTYASDGVTPKAPMAGSVVRLWVDERWAVPWKHWYFGADGHTIHYVDGHHPIDQEVATLEYTPGA